MRKADNLTTILCHCHVIWEPELPEALWAPRACSGTDFLNLVLYLLANYRMSQTSNVSENVELTLTKGHKVISIMFYICGIIQKKGVF